MSFHPEKSPSIHLVVDERIDDEKNAMDQRSSFKPPGMTPYLASLQQPDQGEPMKIPRCRETLD